MPPSATYVPRVHLADPAEASDLCRAVRDAVAGTLVGRPERRPGFERLRGRVAVRVGSDEDPAVTVVGLVFDRGTAVVWDGAPPGGAQVQLAVPVDLGVEASGRMTASRARLVGRAFLRPDGRRRPRLATGTLRVLGVL